MSVSAPSKLTIKDYKADLHNDWCPGCLAPDTRIVTQDGDRPISEIAVGEEVLGHDGRFHRVTEVMSHRHDATLHRLGVRYLGEVLITSDHPVCIARQRPATLDLEWVPAAAVKPGDLVAYPIARKGTQLAALPAGRGTPVATCELSIEAAHAEYLLVVVESNEVLEYTGMVHNLEVEDVHSYVSSIGALHNCGDFGILTALQMALAQLQLDPDRVALFSGIGCSGKTLHYVKAYGFHTLHGRVLPVATGSTRPCSVWKP